MGIGFGGNAGNLTPFATTGKSPHAVNFTIPTIMTAPATQIVPVAA